MLKIQHLQAGYGTTPVLFDLNLALDEGQVVTLMGRNGMGKTTTIRTIMGLLRATGGKVSFAGGDITACAPEQVARRGAGLVPEGRRIFPSLTVRENLIATAANRLNAPRPWTLSRIVELFPRLGERQEQMAGTLSGGEQQMLAISRALMTNPRLLILDEATEGLAPVIRSEIWACLNLLKSEGQSILIVDKNLRELKRLADRHVIIEKGRTVWQGSSADLDRDAEQVQRYVGI